jgi:hypothetical protein
VPTQAVHPSESESSGSTPATQLIGETKEPPKPTEPQNFFGRIPAPNPGSQRYPLKAALPRAAFAGASRRSKTWQFGKGAKELVGPHGGAHSSGRGWQSQSSTPHCVRYGNTHVLLLEPITRLNAWELTNGLYAWAQKNDPWSGENYDGTSVDAGLQYLLHIAKVIAEYRWCVTMDDVRARLTAKASDGGGPMVVGTDFYSGMGNLDNRPATLEEPALWVPDGNFWGGHCYVWRGWKKATAKRSARVLTGNSHIDNEEGEMEESAAEWLLFAQNGEGAAITELPRGYARRAA